MEGFRLDGRQRLRLRHALRTTADANQCRRILTLLEIADGKPISHVARLLGVSRQSVYNWMGRYAACHSPASLVDDERAGRPPRWTDEVDDVIDECMKWSPEACGYQAVSWTIPLLQSHLFDSSGESFSRATIRRRVRALGYAWKRSRYVLQPDPEREKKTPDSAQSPGIAASNGTAVRG